MHGDSIHQKFHMPNGGFMQVAPDKVGTFRISKGSKKASRERAISDGVPWTRSTRKVRT